MKILEACRQTGLTERTIRFYIEKGLLHPESSEMNGRVYYTFNKEDISRLGVIAALRKAGFALDDVAAMRRDAGRIPAILSTHISAMRERERETAAICRALSAVEGKQFTGAGELADALKRGVGALTLPRADIQPDFARFDSETPEEREAGYADFLVRQRIRDKTAVILRPLKTAGIILCAAAALLLIVYAFSCIPKGIEKTYTGTDFRVDDAAGGTPVGIRVQGKLYRRLFQEPIFDGKIILDTVDYSKESVVELRFANGMGSPAWLVYDRVIKKPDGSILPDLQSFGMVLTDADFSYLAVNCFDMNGDGGGTLGNRVICAPAGSAGEGKRLLEEKDIAELIGR